MYTRQFGIVFVVAFIFIATGCRIGDHAMTSLVNAENKADGDSKMNEKYDEGRIARFNGEYDKAFEIFKELAEKGHLLSITEYAQMLECGVGTPIDQEEAFRWLQKAADLHNPDAMYALGFFYLHGCFGSYDSRKKIISIKTVETNEKTRRIGLEWYKKAADSGHQQCMYQLARMYLYDAMKKSNKESEKNALHWLIKLEKLDNGDALVVLGCMAYLGVIIPQDKEQARAYFQRAAKSSDFTASEAAESILARFNDLGDGESLRPEFETW